MSAEAIDEIEDRLQDLAAALREAGAENLALDLERHALDFTQPTRVRRSVNALREQVEQFRQGTSELPDSPKVMLAANRLEDVCRDALKAGMITAAPLTLAAQTRRKLAIALSALLGGGVLLLIPIVLVRAGIDFSDLGSKRQIGPLPLPRGEESKVAVSVLLEALVPRAVHGVEFEPEGECHEPLADDESCSEAPARLWAEGRQTTYEVKLRNQAYGLLFSIVAPHLSGAGRMGEAQLLLAATDDTPEGRYLIPLRGAYVGYTPQSCEFVQRVLGDCPPPRVGDRERHVDLPVPVVVVDVLPGDPARRLGEKRRQQAEAEEARRAAEERAQQIGASVHAIEGVLRETEKLMARARYEQVRERVQKLATLFAPLESVSLAAAEGEAPAVSEVRARFEALRDKLQKFEDKLFEQTFVAVTAESNRRVPEDSLLARIAQRTGVPTGYVRDVYTSRAEEMQRRLDAKVQARMDKIKGEEKAREQRCGALPLEAWHSVERYLREVYNEPRVEIVLGECLTPRLTERECWEMRCDFQRLIEVAVERPKVVEKHAATFYLLNGKVVRHRNAS